MSIATPADIYSACREVLRLRHLSYRAEQTYLGVIRRYVAYRQTGPGGLPLALRLSEGLGVTRRQDEDLPIE